MPTPHRLQYHSRRRLLSVSLSHCRDDSSISDTHTIRAVAMTASFSTPPPAVYAYGAAASAAITAANVKTGGTLVCTAPTSPSLPSSFIFSTSACTLTGYAPPSFYTSSQSPPTMYTFLVSDGTTTVSVTATFAVGCELLFFCHFDGGDVAFILLHFVFQCSASSGLAAAFLSLRRSLFRLR